MDIDLLIKVLALLITIVGIAYGAKKILNNKIIQKQKGKDGNINIQSGRDTNIR